MWWIPCTLGGEYKAKQNWCHKLFQCKNFLKFKDVLVLINDSECKKRLHGVWTAWFIVKWFTALTFYICSKQCLPIKLTRLLCHCFVNSDFPQKTNLAFYKYTVKVLKFMQKKRKANEMFSKIVCGSKVTSQGTLQINKIHLDHGCCWQHLQEAIKKLHFFSEGIVI